MSSSAPVTSSLQTLEDVIDRVFFLVWVCGVPVHTRSLLRLLWSSEVAWTALGVGSRGAYSEAQSPDIFSPPPPLAEEMFGERAPEVVLVDGAGAAALPSPGAPPPPAVDTEALGRRRVRGLQLRRALAERVVAPVLARAAAAAAAIHAVSPADAPSFSAEVVLLQAVADGTTVGAKIVGREQLHAAEALALRSAAEADDPLWPTKALLTALQGVGVGGPPPPPPRLVPHARARTASVAVSAAPAAVDVDSSDEKAPTRELGKKRPRASGGSRSLLEFFRPRRSETVVVSSDSDVG